MVVIAWYVAVFTTICAIRAYHHQRCEFEYCACIWQGLLDTTLYDTISQ